MSAVDQAGPELLPCAHCGGKASIVSERDMDADGRFYFVKCGECGSKGAESYASETCPHFYEGVRAAWNRRADLAAPSAPAEVIDAEAVAEAMDDDAGRWQTCSGCYEICDGHPVGSYPYSSALQCNLGGGCRECGGIGAIWGTTDYADMGDCLARGHEASAPAEVEGLTDTQKIERMADLNWKPASQYWKEQHDAKATALTALQAENERLRAELRVMHRRAQKAEGRAERLLWWLGGIKRLADLSKHWRMGSFADAAMRGSKPDTGTAWMLGHLTCRREAEAAVARAEKAEAERDEALAQRDTWMERAMSELGDNLADHAKLKGEV